MTTFILKNKDHILVYFSMHAPINIDEIIIQGFKLKP